jgi:hypothetical protein
MTTKNLKQILSTSLSLVLVVSSAPIPAGAMGPVDAAAPAFVAALTPPERFGYVSSSFSPKSDAERPRLIIISDLHGHIEVQKNIMGMLDKLVDTLHVDKKVPIFLEGGWTPNLEEPLRGVTNPKVRAFLDEYLLHKAELSAGQAYSEKVAGSDKVSLIGVENQGEYERNKAVFVKTYPVRKKLIVALRREEKALKQLSDAISNRAFLSLQKMRDDYNAGKVQPEQFARMLVRQAGRTGISGHYVDVLKNAATASPNDLDVAYSEIYKLVSVRLSEARPMTAFLRQSIGDEADLRQKIAIIDSRLDLLNRLVGNQLTPAEVPLAMARMEELVQVAQMLVPPDSVNMNVGDVVRDSLNFYPYAMVRNETLVKNSLSALDKMGPDATGILIVGGFHAQAIDQYLQDHQISYMQLNPTITRDLSADEQLNYIKRVCNDHVTSTELSGDLEALQNGGSSRLAGAAVGPSTFLHEGQMPPDGKVQNDLAGGLTASQVALLTADNAAMQAAVSKLDAATAEAVAAVDANNEDIQHVLGLANAERAKDGKEALSADDFVQTFSLDRLNNGLFEENGKDDTDAAYILNESLKALHGENAAEHIDGMNVAIVDDQKNPEILQKLGAGAAILGIHEGQGGRPLLILTKTRADALLKLRQIKQAVKEGRLNAADPAVDNALRALGDFAHEVLGHAFNPEGQGNSEVSALRYGVAGAVALGLHFFTGIPGMGTDQEIALRVLGALAPQFADVKVKIELEQGKEIEVSAWSVIVPGLAKMISNLIAPVELTDAQVQDVISRVQKDLPAFTDLQIKQLIANENSRLKQAIHYEPGDEGEKEDEVVKQITSDADNVAQDAGQVVTNRQE